MLTDRDDSIWNWSFTDAELFYGSGVFDQLDGACVNDVDGIRRVGVESFDRYGIGIIL